MATRVEPPESDWSDLEQRFFEAAPPDVPQPPVTPMSFADLDAELPEPRPVGGRFTRAARAAQLAEGGELPPPTVAERFGTAARRSWSALRPLGARVGRACAAAWRGAGPALGAAREASSHVVRVGVARFLDGLPAERPDRRTIVGVVAGLVVLTGLSAGVVASRDGGGSRVTAAAMTASVLAIPTLPSPKAAEPAPRPALPVEVAAPTATLATAEGRPVAAVAATAEAARTPTPVVKKRPHRQQHAAASRVVAVAHPPAVKPIAPATKPATAAAKPIAPVTKPTAVAARPIVPVTKPTVVAAKPIAPAKPVAKPAAPMFRR